MPTYSPPAEHRFRNGQPIKFDFDEQIRLVIVRSNNRVDLMSPSDPLEVELMQKQLAHAVDGRFVGIYIAPARSRVFEQVEDGPPDADGKQAYKTVEKWVYLPGQVVPLISDQTYIARELRGDEESHHLTTAVDGRAVNIAFEADSLRRMDPVLLAEDEPAYRRKNNDPNWNPRP